MGGDHAPKMVLKGANIALQRYPELRFIFFGNQELIEENLKRLKKLSEASTIVHTDTVITTDMKPSLALRRAKDSSMRLAINAVKNGEADCVISAGNTGALMAISQFVFRNLPGIDRPAMASFMPTRQGEVVMLDLGANIECQSKNLVQFSIMGSLFAQSILSITNPKIGLLNIGAEEGKGSEVLKETNKTLQNMELPGEYMGFIEGNDIHKGKMQVVVTDGFSGNIALKVTEGTASLISEFLKRSFIHSFFSRIGYFFARRSLHKLWFRLDPRRYNGAVMLGVDGIVVKSHGGTDALGFATAISVALDMVTDNYVEVLKGKFEAETSTGASDDTAEDQAQSSIETS